MWKRSLSCLYTFWHAIPTPFYFPTSLILINRSAHNCVPHRQLGSCSVTRTFRSLRRVWLARLIPIQVREVHISAVYYSLAHTVLLVPRPSLSVQLPPLPQKLDGLKRPENRLHWNTCDVLSTRDTHCLSYHDWSLVQQTNCKTVVWSNRFRIAFDWIDWLVSSRLAGPSIHQAI